jgi:NitT/TauT family transport system ATP-binding protein
MSAIKISFEQVRKEFSVRGEGGGPSRRFTALEDITLDVRTGEFLALVGPSGCGKSTLLDLLGGLAVPTSGRILLDGRPITGPARDRGIVFQQYALFPWRTAAQNVEFGLDIAGLKSKERRDRARHYLDLVGLAAFADRYPHELSGGMKQRVAIARSLAYDPEVLLMDEPFAALDEQTRMVLGEDISVLLARTRKTIVFVTHSLVEAVFLADRVAVFSARPGRIKSIIPVEEGHPRSRSFMTSEKLGRLRNELYELLHDEIRKTMTLRKEINGTGGDTLYTVREGEK